MEMAQRHQEDRRHLVAQGGQVAPAGREVLGGQGSVRGMDPTPVAYLFLLVVPC